MRAEVPHDVAGTRQTRSMTTAEDPAGGTAPVDAAWQRFCARLARTGERITADDFPRAPHARAEGLRHLSRLVVHALQWHLEAGDPDFPVFVRFDDDFVKWGGPNVDNHYLRARIDPTGTYAVRGDVTGVRECLVSTPEGDMQLGRMRVFEERSLADLAVDADGSLEILLAPGERDHPNHVPLHPDVEHVLVRVYVADWLRDAVPAFSIERLDRVTDAPPPLAPDAVAAGLDAAATWVEASVAYWSRYLRTSRERGTDNVLSPPRAVPGGAADILYGGGWWSLQPGQALLVEFPPPRARYWSIQLYSEPWFESLDIHHRTSSVNGEQAAVDDDGVVRVVVSAEDPGIPNWLDTEGRPAGLVSYRWVWSHDAPVPATTLTTVDAVRGPWSSSERRAQVAERRAGVVRRFRR
jgi:hypothetical protein